MEQNPLSQVCSVSRTSCCAQSFARNFVSGVLGFGFLIFFSSVLLDGICTYCSSIWGFGGTFLLKMLFKVAAARGSSFGHLFERILSPRKN